LCLRCDQVQQVVPIRHVLTVWLRATIYFKPQ
jgi:hypothetical protein